MLTVPEDFAIMHVAIGYQGVTSLFGHHSDALVLGGSSIQLRPVFSGCVNPKVEVVNVATAPTPTLTPEPEPTPPAPVEQIDLPPVVQLAAVPAKILIGKKSNGEPVYWHYGHPKLPNRHMLIFGGTGSGKTYGIQCLLAEMASQNLHSLIVDYTDGFLPQHIEKPFQHAVKLKNNYIYSEKLPLNPFQAQQRVVDPSLPLYVEKPFDVATRVANIFNSVYESMGDQQSSALIRIVEQGIIKNPAFSMDDIPDLLRAEGSQSAESLASKLDPFIRSEPFCGGTDSSWKTMLTSTDHWVNVLQLTTLARDIQKLVTEFALWNLYDYACSTGDKDRPIPIVLDEIQNLDHRSNSPIDKMIREGRKFGLSLILATQTTSNFDQEQRDRLFQAGHKLFFKPATTEIASFATILSTATSTSKADWAERLSKLEKGQCWSLGPAITSNGMLKEAAFLVSITSLEQRGFQDE
jgi:DNA phosphorothioation-dependent restriction protein DptH